MSIRAYKVGRCYGIRIGRLAVEAHMLLDLWWRNNSCYNFVVYRNWTYVRLLWIGGLMFEWRKRA